MAMSGARQEATVDGLGAVGTWAAGLADGERRGLSHSLSS